MQKSTISKSDVRTHIKDILVGKIEKLEKKTDENFTEIETKVDRRFEAIDKKID